MKNFLSFLCHREQGLSAKNWKETQLAEEVLERHACTPEVNQPCALSGQCRATFLMDFSPDRTKVASTHGDHTVRVTELATGKCTHVLAGHSRTPWCLAFHPSSNQILASGCLAGEVRIWDLKGGGSEVWRCKDNNVIASMTFHPIDHVLVFAVGNKIYFWDWNQPEPFACCQTKHIFERIRLVRFDSVGHYLYTGIANNTMAQQVNTRVSFINGRNNPVCRPQRTQRLSNVYNNLVECFQAYRREHVMNESTSNAETEQPESTEVQENSSTRRSPVHEEGLNYARQYAAHVTEETRPLVLPDSEIMNATATESNPDSLPFIEADNVPQFMPPRPYAWSPPPRGASQADETDGMIIEDGDMDQRSSDTGHMTTDLDPGVLVTETNQTRRSQVPSTSRNPLLESSAFPSSLSSNQNPPMVSNHNPESNLLNSITSRENRFEVQPTTRVTCHSDSSNSNTDTGLNRNPSDFHESNLGRTPVLRTDSNTDRLHGTNCDNRSCEVCRNFNTSRFLYRQRGPLSTRSSTLSQYSSLSSRRFSHARSAFSQPSQSYRHRYLNLNPSRVQVQSFGSNSGQRHAVRESTPQNLASTHVTSSQTETNNLETLVTSHLSETSQQSRFGSFIGSQIQPRTESNSQLEINQPSELQAQVETSSNRLNTDLQTHDNQLEREHANQSQTLHRNQSESDDSIQSNPLLRRQEGSRDQSETSEQIQTNSGDAESGQGYQAIQDNFASITARIEREMDELDRRITSLRNSFHESIQQLQQDRDSYLISRQNLSPAESQESGGIRPRTPSTQVTSQSQGVTTPVITITRCDESGRQRACPEQPSNQNIPNSVQETSSSRRTNGPPHPLLETALRSSTSTNWNQSSVQEQDQVQQRGSIPSTFALPPSTHSWHALQRHHLHPHYSVSILDDTINRPNDALQTAINRAIAGAFMGRGEPAVASNIINQTHRIQAWDFTKCSIPDITDASVNVIVPNCKLHNDASCDISQDCSLLGTFVPSHRGFPDDNILAVFSLLPKSRGQCLFTKSFGPNAISVSLSPKSNFVMVGLAAKRLSWVFTANQLVAQVYKMETELAGEKSTKHISDIMHPCDMDIRTHVSVNSARWLPGVGDGIIYGTNRGDLHICRPGAKKESEKEKPADQSTSGTSIRRNLMHMLGLSSTAVPLISIGTQTAERRSAGTQTE